jgi:hypothetical protein
VEGQLDGVALGVQLSMKISTVVRDHQNDFGELWSIVCRTCADILAFDHLVALRLDFPGLRENASRYDAKQVCDCDCTEIEDSEHLLLRCRAVHEERVVMFLKVSKLCRAFRRRHASILEDFLLGPNSFARVL